MDDDMVNDDWLDFLKAYMHIHMHANTNVDKLFKPFEVGHDKNNII